MLAGVAGMVSRFGFCAWLTCDGVVAPGLNGVDRVSDEVAGAVGSFSGWGSGALIALGLTR